MLDIVLKIFYKILFLVMFRLCMVSGINYMFFVFNFVIYFGGYFESEL